MKLHFAFSLILIFAVTACTSTNDIQPVEPVTSVTPATPVSEENRRLETIIQTEYAGYDEMVERGFDIHINMPGLSLPVSLTTTSFSNIYGTREELEAQGYTENETIILYDNSSASAAECFYFLAKCNPDYVYGRPNGEIYFTITDYDYGRDFIEGRGLLPDAWAVTPEEYIKTMQWYTGDEGLDHLY